MVDWVAKVLKKNGHNAIKYFHSQDLIDNNLMIIIQDDWLIIPLNSNYHPNQTINLEFEIEFIRNQAINPPYIFTPKKGHKIPLLRDAVASKIPSELIQFVPNSYDIIGSIAILELNRYEQTELNPYTSLIAKIMLETNHALTTVVCKAGDVDGVFRTRKYELLAGEKTTQTIHKENNCRFLVDLEKTFFTPRLVYERKRLTEFDHPLIYMGITWDMFCGVGPFLIQIAKHHQNGTFLGTDINPVAIELAQKNAQMNHITSKVEFFAQDLINIEKEFQFLSYQGKITRFILNLPERNLDFLHILPLFISPTGAIIHIYQFNDKEDPCSQAETLFREKCKASGIIIREILLNRIVKPFSPSKDTTVIDAIIEKA
jgi:tRNA (guanine37-N1)-methyltransferase